MSTTAPSRVIYLGQAKIRALFGSPQTKMIAGSYVFDGKIKCGARARLVRDGSIIYTGKISSLRRFKDDVDEVSSGNLCGLILENCNEIKIGDFIEVFA